MYWEIQKVVNQRFILPQILNYVNKETVQQEVDFISNAILLETENKKFENIEKLKSVLHNSVINNYLNNLSRENYELLFEELFLIV